MSGADTHKKDSRSGKHSSHRKHTTHVYRYGSANPRLSSSASTPKREPTKQAEVSSTTQERPLESNKISSEDIAFNNISDDVGGVRDMILDHAVIAFPNIADKYRVRFRHAPITEAFRVSVVPVYDVVRGSMGGVRDFRLVAFLAYRKEGSVQHTELAMGAGAPDIALTLHSLLEVLGDCVTEGQEAGGLLRDLTGPMVFKSRVNLYSACVDSRARDRGQAWEVNSKAP